MSEILSFEPTEEQKECEHEKVFANYILTSNPPKYPWVCRKCKLQGCDRGKLYSFSNEYEEIITEL